jgi:hypothetical protein
MFHHGRSYSEQASSITSASLVSRSVADLTFSVVPVAKGEAAALDTLEHASLPEKGPAELRRAAHAFNTIQDRLRRSPDSRARIIVPAIKDRNEPNASGA